MSLAVVDASVLTVFYAAGDDPRRQAVLNQLAAAGFVLEHALEPGPCARQAERVPGNREVPTLLLIRAHLSAK